MSVCLKSPTRRALRHWQSGLRTYFSPVKTVWKNRMW